VRTAATKRVYNTTTKHFYEVAEMFYKTKTREEVTGEVVDGVCFCLISNKMLPAIEIFVEKTCSPYAYVFVMFCE